MMIQRKLLPFMLLIAFLVVGCDRANRPQGVGTRTVETVPPILPIATTSPSPSPVNAPLVAAPTVTETERARPVPTLLYLTSFDSHRLSIIDPVTGESIDERVLQAQQPGLAVAPDGRRLYILDGVGQAGELSVLDTRTRQAIGHVAVPEMALLLGGNPLSLSGDGRWLFVQHFSYTDNRAWTTLFDTSKNLMLDRNPLDKMVCSRIVSLPQFVGRPGHPRLYLQCDAEIIALDSETLSPVWKLLAPDMRPSALTLSSDGRTLYGIYPLGNVGCFGENPNDWMLYQWNSDDGTPARQSDLGKLVSMPEVTCGRGGRVYMLSGLTDSRLYIAWEDRLWALAPDSGQVTVLQLPSAVDGMVASVDGRELYLLPATAGDLQVRERGMYVVDTERLMLLRHVSDWPELISPIIFAAPGLP